MPIRTTPLVNNQYYHVYNRGVARNPTFFGKKDYERFISLLSYYRFTSPPLRFSKFLLQTVENREKILHGLSGSSQEVSVCCYCLMPNHFHLLLRQMSDKGISDFMKRVSDGFTKYINIKHKRVGPVFQGAFKAVRIESDEQLIHVSRYIHINPIVDFVVKTINDLLEYPWSSIKSYLYPEVNRFVDGETVLSQFSSREKYKEFILNQIDYAQTLREIKHLCFMEA